MNVVRAMCAAMLLFGAVSARGQEVQAAGEEEASGGFGIDFSLTVPSTYVFRGYVIQDNRFIVQPDASVSFDTTLGGFSISPYVGAWANFTDVSAPGDPECFDELDLYAGADIELGHGLTLGVIYTYYMSPADTFDDIHEIGVTLSHDDWFNPSIGIYRELCNKNGDENTYIELSITPGCDFPQVDKLSFEFPMAIGLSPDEYYTDSDGDGEWIGFLMAGVHATYVLTDNLSLLAGLEYWNLHADSTQESNGGSENQCVALIGIQFSQ